MHVYNASFSSLIFHFIFCKDNYEDLSPRVKEALTDRPLVPIGGAFVKSSRLFFRLAKDLAPFFYEVPRGKFILSIFKSLLLNHCGTYFFI